MGRAHRALLCLRLLVCTGPMRGARMIAAPPRPSAEATMACISLPTALKCATIPAATWPRRYFGGGVRLRAAVVDHANVRQPEPQPEPGPRSGVWIHLS